MYESDKRILRLIELLIFEKKIDNASDFCTKIDMLKQTVSKIKNGNNHFTVIQIEKICKTFDVNANWIFGTESKVFNSSDSIIIDKI